MVRVELPERRGTTHLRRIRKNAFHTRQLTVVREHPALLKPLRSLCFLVPIESNKTKSRDGEQGDEGKLESSQAQQTGSTEGCCVPGGRPCAPASSSALRSDSGARDCGRREKTRVSPTLPQWALSEADWPGPLCLEGEMFFPCVDGAQLKEGPRCVDTAGGYGSHVERPSTRTQSSEKQDHMPERLHSLRSSSMIKH